MHFLQVVSVFVTASLVSAAPTGDVFKTKYQFTGCKNLSGIQQPVDTLNATNRLPAPVGNLVRVAIGVGTQNYTCSDPSLPPSAVGALATLYDADCLAADNMGLLESLPATLVQTPGNAQTIAAGLLSQVSKKRLVVGHHYFEDLTTPVFDFHSAGGKGKLVAQLANKIPAPAGSSTGRAPDNYGAVAWLYLTAKPNGGTKGGYTSAYRLVTAGGAPPKTCDGQPSFFTIPYAATYWIYE